MSMAVSTVLLMTTSTRGGADHRSDLKPARTSVVKRSGSCQAAKWLFQP